MSQGEFPDSGADQPAPKHVSARVPESVAKGEFCTGVVVMASPQELVLDFIQTLVQPNQLVSRVVLPWPTLPSLLKALKQNLDNHDNRFGAQKAKQSTEQKSSAADVDEEESDRGDKVLAGKSLEEKVSDKISPGSQPLTRRVEAAGFYDELRFEDKTLRGVYANGAMINHTEFEFKLDFLSTLHPYPVVVARIFMSEPQMRRLLVSLEQHGSQRRG